MPKKSPKRLDPSIQSDEERELLETLQHCIVGQEGAIAALVDAYEVFRSGLSDPDRPISNLIFLGPTGCGKTLSLEVMAEALFGTKQALKKIDCAEFQHSHEIAKLVGCFIPGTRVLMADGTAKPIECVKVGDLVITKDGSIHPVTNLHSYEHDGPIKEILVGNSNIPVGCTQVHEIWAIQLPHNGGRATTKAERILENSCIPEQLKDVPAGMLEKGDILTYPRQKIEQEGFVIDLVKYSSGLPKHHFDETHIWTTKDSGRLNRFIKVDKSFMRLAGFYVSEGGNSKARKTINFTFGRHAQDGPCIQEVKELLRKVFGEAGAINTKTRKSSHRIYYSSRTVSYLMADLFGDHALRKKLPGWFFKLSPELLYNLIDTAILGDGGKSVRRRIDYSTSSENLAYQMRLLLCNLGYASQMQRHSIKDKRGYKSSPRYRLYVAGKQIDRLVVNLPATGKSINVFNPGNIGIQRMAHVDDDYTYLRLKSIKTIQYKGIVHDLSVEGESSYVTEFIVHNSPPGYLGHKETPAYLRQENLDSNHTKEIQLTLLLFDEFEKANDSLWNLMLGITDKGTATMGDGKTTAFGKCIIAMSGNLGSREMQYLVTGGMGFSGSSARSGEDLDRATDNAAMEAVRKRLTPEFLNRIDQVVVFHSLSGKQLEQVVEIELEQVQQRVFRMRSPHHFALGYTDEAKALLLAKGTDLKNGARPLKRIIEKMLVKKLSRLLNTGQVKLGDLIMVDVEGDGLGFTRVAEGVLPQEEEMSPPAKSASA